jgi:hypothetical protein
MMRLSLVLAGLAVVVASCSVVASDSAIEPDVVSEQSSSTATTTSAVPAPTPSTSNSEPTPSESAARSSVLAGTTTTSEATETTMPGPPPEGPPAPDFTLALGEDGSDTFTLSQESKPVFMIFWAEW